MRASLAIGLMLIMLFQGMGCHWLFQWRLSDWRHEQWEKAEHQMADGELDPGLTQLHLHDLSGLRWIERHEFLYQGQLYDLLDAQPDGQGGWNIRAIADHLEQRLKHDYALLMGGFNPDPAQAPASTWSRLLAASYVMTPSIHLGQPTYSDANPKHLDLQAFNQPFLSKWSPPPQGGKV